ncbi:MAG: hypothetical protein ACR2G8_04160 [Candidatus Limnocylindria bacterium]|jgi:hypothetical protein
MSESQLNAPLVACTLSSSDFQRRAATWESVMSALRDKLAIDGGVRLEFEPDHKVTHALTDLVHAERECCGWASWVLVDTSSTTAVEVTAEGAGARAARELFGIE